jgi:uncharacterized protein YjdB
MSGSTTTTVGVVVQPPAATDKSVTFSSDTMAVATVAPDGQDPSKCVITALSAGSAIITVTTTDGSFTDDLSLTVNA